MSTDWDGYRPFDPGVDRPLHELARKEAVAAFKRLMAAKAERVAALHQLLLVNHVQLGDSEEEVRKLDHWFRTNVEKDEGKTGRLAPRWYAVVNDVALFLGDVVVSRCPQIRWSFYEGGRSDVAFQRHVLTGFSKVANPKFNFDVDLAVATYGHRIVTGLVVADDHFNELLGAAVAKA